MVDFSSPVAVPSTRDYAPPAVDFSQLSNLASTYRQAGFDEQQKKLNDAKLQQLQQQTELSKAFAGGLPTDPQTGQIDYRKAAGILAAKGDIGGAVSLLQQQPAPPPPIFGGQGAPGQAPGATGQPAGAQPSSIQSKPLPPPAAGAPQGDSGSGTIASLVTDRLPGQDTTTGQTIAKIAEKLGVDANAQLTPGQVRRAQGLLDRYAPKPADSAAGQPARSTGPAAAGQDQSGGSAPTSFSDRFAAAGPGGANLPPSANAGTPRPQPATASRGPAGAPAAPPSAPAPAGGSPAAGQPPAPQQAPQQAPQPAPQAAPQQPLTPQVPLPPGYTDPQKAIADLRAYANQHAGNPKERAYVERADAWANQIAESLKPISVRPGETLLDPRTRQPLYQAPTAAQQRNSPEVAGRIADAIASGEQPPMLTALRDMTGPVRAALQEKGFDLSKAQIEWQRAQKQIASLNGPQMTRFVGLADSVNKTIDEVRDLSEELQNSGVPAFNRFKMEAYMKSRGNTPEGQLVAKYIGAVNTLKEEFANLAQGGYAPTEAVWKLANEQVNGDYGVKQLSASLDEIQRLIRYRVNAIPNLTTLGPGAGNRYVPGQPGQPSVPSPAQGSPKAQGTTSSGLTWSVE